MRGSFVFAAFICLASCGPSQPPPSASGPLSEHSAKEASVTSRYGAVDGWQTDITAYPLAGETLPPFSARLDNGTTLTQAGLRNRWTIIGFRHAGDKADEKRFITALNAAADQDPDLDFLGVTIMRSNSSAESEGEQWPHIGDDGALADALRIDSTPAYLLVGPDLTIEGYRGALMDTPDNGIKSVVRGVAEIRKQIAAPE